MIDGMANFDEVAELLGINSDEIGDFDTLNGFLISLIDKIPSEDEQISEKAYGYLFEILSVENKMIKKVHVVKLPDEPSEEGNEDEPADEDRTYDNKELEEADS
jgi:putative hemolysin